MGWEIPDFRVGVFAADVAMPNGQFSPVWLGTATSGATYGYGNGNAALVAIGSRTDPPLGILQQPLIQGEHGNVMVSGVSKAKYGGTIAVGDPLGWDATGLLLIKAVSTKFAIGTAMEAGVTGDVGSVLLVPRGVQ